MTHDEIIAVVEAHRQGKAIQYRSRFDENPRQWIDCGNHKLTGQQHPVPGFDFSRLEYRVKPEPHEWWFVKNIGKQERYGWSRHEVRQEGVDFLEQIHVREVLE